MSVGPVVVVEGQVVDGGSKTNTDRGDTVRGWWVDWLWGLGKPPTLDPA